MSSADHETLDEGEGGPSFTAAMHELNDILGELEADEVDIDRLAVNVRRAAELISECRRRITAVEMEIEQVMTELDGDVADPPPVV